MTANVGKTATFSAVIVIVTSRAQWQRLKPRLAPGVAEGVGALLIVLTALTLAAITVMSELLTTRLGLPMLIDSRSMTASVAVVLALQDLPGREEA
jgi:cytochrome b